MLRSLNKEQASLLRAWSLEDLVKLGQMVLRDSINPYALGDMGTLVAERLIPGWAQRNEQIALLQQMAEAGNEIAILACDLNEESNAAYMGMLGLRQ